MTEFRAPLRVALFGLPGAGKSTSGGLLRQTLAEMGRDVAIVKTATPLYDVQEFFYSRIGLPLATGQQDGALLNFLGSHFRAVDPEFLLADFAQRWGNAALGGANAVICDDARPADSAGLAWQGFTIVRVTAPEDVRRRRKAGRGDRTAGADDHPTELGIDTIVPDFEIDNSAGLDELRARVADLAKKLIALPPQPASGGDGGARLASLVRLAQDTISARYAENRHQIAAVIVAGDGRVFTGLHLEAMVGRASICAEAVALGKARAAGASDLRIVLAVRHPKPSEERREIRLVPPCGLCREILLDYSRDMMAVVRSDGGPALVALSELLPHKYVGTKWAVAPVAEGR
ncbi:cytidine deaminase [Thermocatellispora tengchongensis]|uniref:Cytidine deaminase n=1 Tax=Thermocatellispora tengchongensis TaxID=1073253 RepID=A0A840P1D5_9ACTN|nr:cytidine deaminase [Thermocatellispora tengchongensis]MBB5132276.1 cytidine deaminase [Thermocatellispora tengchongensis]